MTRVVRKTRIGPGETPLQSEDGVEPGAAAATTDRPPKTPSTKRAIRYYAEDAWLPAKM